MQNKTTSITRGSYKKWLTAVSAVAIFVAPIAIGATAANAAPRGSWPGNNNNNSRRTLEGIVTQDLAGRNFTLRVDNREIQVRLNQEEPRRLSRGDKVRVEGYYTNNLFLATKLEILVDRNNNNGWNNNERRTLEGRVIDDKRGDRFVMRTDTGRSVEVDSNKREPRRLSNGDRVRVYGRFNDKVFSAESITIVRDNNGWNNRSYNGQGYFDGTVDGIRGDRDFDLRSNGNTFNVKLNRDAPRRLSRGDSVRVFGSRTANNGIINATVLFMNDNSGWNNNNNNNGSKTYEGVVDGIRGDREFDLRSGSNTYNVKLNREAPRRLSRGDRVRVLGTRSGDNDIINATVIYLNNNNAGWNNNNNNNNNNNYRTFTGRVSDTRGDREFDLKAGGDVFNVKLSSDAPRRLNRDDEVRVYGVRSGTNDIINASVAIIQNR